MIGFFKVIADDGRAWGYVNTTVADRRMEQLRAEGVSFKFMNLNCAVEAKREKKKEKPVKIEAGKYQLIFDDKEELVTGWGAVQIRMQNLRGENKPFKVYKWSTRRCSWNPIKKSFFQGRA